MRPTQGLTPFIVAAPAERSDAKAVVQSMLEIEARLATSECGVPVALRRIPFRQYRD